MNDLDTRLAIGAAYRRDPTATMHGFPAYQRLDRGNAARVDDFLRAHGRDEDTTIALRHLVESPAFGACDDAAQAALLDAARSHPEAETIRSMQRLAADPSFRSLDGARADLEAERLASGEGPGPQEALARSGMPVPHRSPATIGQAVELVLQAADYAEVVTPFSLPHVIAHGVGWVAGAGALEAALPVAGGVLAGAGGALTIYGSIHAAEQAHEDGRAIGEAAAHGHGFAAHLQELASGSPAAPRHGAEARGAARADAYWDALGPADRVALQSPATGGRFFADLEGAVLARAMGRGR